MKRIAAVTGSRADYGHLYWVLREIESRPDLDLSVVAACMHLAPEFGLTRREIEADGFAIHFEVDMLLSSDTPTGTAISTGLGFIGFAQAFRQLSPDMVLALGDRFEALAAAGAALLSGIPVAHIHGGESSEGALDEAVRHAVSKLSHLHFTSTEVYRDRLIRMGEDPERVFNFGAPGLEHLERTELAGKRELEETLSISLDDGCFLVTFHPATADAGGVEEQLSELLSALDGFDRLKVFTRAGADAGGLLINRLLEEHVSRSGGRARLFDSLGYRNYLSLMAQALCVVGNSSSGIIEAPSVGVPTVDVGSRQRGRVRAGSVVSVPEVSAPAIRTAIERAVSEDFRASMEGIANPYRGERTSSRIAGALAAAPPASTLLAKRFHEPEVPGVR